MKRYSVLLAILLVLPGFSMAQNFADAYRMSFNQIQGTARSAGMGNAFGALGGDFTSLSINPAGSAIYQTGEFVITPGYYVNKSKMTLGGSSFSDNDQNFSLNNIGAVGTFKTNRSEAGIVSVNYGVGYNRLANFNNNAFANFYKSNRSYVDDIVDYANGEYQNNIPITNAYLNKSIGNIQYSDWPTKLAWQNYLIGPATDINNTPIDGLYQKETSLQNQTVNQQKSYAQEGHIDEYVFNMSLNFNHNFYLGATLGFHDINYESHSSYEEDFGNGANLVFGDDYYLDGSGFNIKLGAIYKPTQNVRFGLAFHSPTFYQLSEKSILDMQSTEQKEGYVDPGINTYDYDFHTPLKVVMSGAVIFNKKGLISIDAEYMDYGSMRFRNGGNGSDNFNDLNSIMSNNFKSVMNIRVGAEYRLTNQFTVRGGYENYGNPFKSTLDAQSTLTDNVSVISGGFGYSVNAFSINVAYTNSLSKISDGSVQPNYYQVNRENTNQNILLTLGFRF